MKRHAPILAVLLCALFVAAEPVKVKENVRPPRSKTTSVTLQWEPSPSTHVVAYKLTWAIEQSMTNSVTVSNTTTMVGNLKLNTEYVFWVNSIDVLGQESTNSSNVVRYRTRSR